MTPINANAGEYRSRIGLDSLYIAEVTADTAAAYTAGTPEYFAPVAEAVQAPSIATETQFADDQPYDVINSQGETVIDLSVTNVPAEMMAKIAGETFNAASGRVFDTGGATEAPYFALLFRSKKSNGSYRYFCFPKGKFEVPGEEAATETDKPSPKQIKLKYHAVKTIHKFDVGGSADQPVKRVFGDQDTTNFDGTTWFNQVQTPVVVAPSALSLSSSLPADNATGVAVSASPTLTFNNALVNSAVNMIVLSKADGTKATATITLDTAKKVITVDPSVNMDASTVYLLTYAVQDIYGQTLSGVVNFTTA